MAEAEVFGPILRCARRAHMLSDKCHKHKAVQPRVKLAEWMHTHTHTHTHKHTFFHLGGSAVIEFYACWRPAIVCGGVSYFPHLRQSFSFN